MSVENLYYEKYLKYKNKYLNLQKQLGGVDPISPIPTIPDELVSSILVSSNSLPVNNEIRQQMKLDSNEFIVTSLKRKLQKTTLDNLFFTGEIWIREPLDNREINSLAEIFVANIPTTTKIYYDISHRYINLEPLITVLSNPNKKLLLAPTISLDPRLRLDIIFSEIFGTNDNYLNFHLRFIFNCFHLMRIDRDIILSMMYFDYTKLINSFNTVILGLKSNISLKELNLYQSNIGVEGAKALADALKTNTKLTKLDLVFNKIENEGAIALASALEKNQTLTEINLANNMIGDEGAIALAKALETNISVRKIYIDRKNITDETKKKIQDSEVATRLIFF